MKVVYAWLVQAGHEGTSNMKNYPKCHGAHSSYSAFSLPACTYGLKGVPYDPVTEEEKFWILKALSGIFLKDSGDEFHPVGIIFKQYILFYILLGKK